jgi:putative ABC transport system permease protein
MSSFWLLVRRSIALHKLSTAVTAISAALACGLVLSVFAIANQTERAFTETDVGFDAVLGARGSELQHVLHTFFHLETSPGQVPWSIVEKLRGDPRVDFVIPFGSGDNYRGFRIVGTSEEFWTRVTFQNGRKHALAVGRQFDARKGEAVLGSFVASRTGLKINDRISPYHGFDFDPKQQHAEQYAVVGILEPTNTPADRVIWIPLEGIWRMQGHVLRGAGEEYVAQNGVPIPDKHKVVSSVGIKLRNKILGGTLAEDINRRGKDYTLAWPLEKSLLELFRKLFWVVSILRAVAYLVVAVAIGGILASIYNTMNERRKEFAILRSLGASRATLSTAIVLEAATIATIGAALGFVVYAGILGAAAAILRTQTGVVLDPFVQDDILWQAPLGMIALGALAGLIPALKAYSTDVGQNLR